MQQTYLQFRNNRLSGYSYDAAGNLLSDGTCSYTYDGEERMSKATCGGTTTTYLYDAEGRRIAKAAGSSISEEYVYDLEGHVVSAYGPYTNQTWLRSEIYAGARHVATYTNGSTYFTQADGLGTERARTDVNGNLCGSATSQPFGDNASSGGCFTASHNFFIGQESDAETGLTYLHARHDNNRFYRFMTADPHNAGANPADPQTWNMYAYARNNPTTLIDPSGLSPVTPNGGTSSNSHVDVDTMQTDCTTDSNGNSPCTANENDGSSSTTPAETQKPPATPAPTPPPTPAATRTPATGKPGTTETFPNKSGGTTTRTYGPDGRAVKDVDTGHDHNGAGDPHTHDWDWSKNPPRQPAPPLTPVETAGANSNKQMSQAAQTAVKTSIWGATVAIGVRIIIAAAEAAAAF